LQGFIFSWGQLYWQWEGRIFCHFPVLKIYCSKALCSFVSNPYNSYFITFTPALYWWFYMTWEPCAVLHEGCFPAQWKEEEEDHSHLEARKT
jgi:hypothetical protein